VVVLGGDEDVPVEPADGRGPLLGVRVLVLPHARGQRLVQVWKRVVGEVDQLEFGVAAPTCLVHHPASNRLASAPGAGASEDDADAGHGWSGPLGPKSSRVECRIMNVVLWTNALTSAAASTPVYSAMIGSAARSVIVSR
jgi:hypothetical protein